MRPPASSRIRRGLTRGSGGTCAGFTMVELLVTISLAAILFAIAIPSFRQMMASSRLTTQSNDFVGAINFARSEAITRNVRMSFCRVGAATDNICAASNGTWLNWIVRTATGNVVRRGEVINVSGIGVTSTLTNDTMVVGADGLASTGGVLISGTAIQINVCSSTTTGTNIRRVTLGGGSRISTQKLEGSC